MVVPISVMTMLDGQGVEREATTAFVIETENRRFWFRQDQFAAMSALVDETGLNGIRCSVAALCPRTQTLFCGGFYDDPVMHWAVGDPDALATVAAHHEARTG